MRITKEHDERKKEILDTAEKLFSQKGYSQCSVNEILTEIGIAKGTFYHYFKSKEDVLDSIIERGTVMIISRAEAAAKNSHSTPEEKLMEIFLSMRIEKEMAPGLLEEMHRPENALMHQKSLCAIVSNLTPILVTVIEQGIKVGAFQAEYPKEYMQIFLSSAFTLFDNGIFHTEPEDQKIMFQALITVLCKMLNINPEKLWKKATFFWENK